MPRISLITPSWNQGQFLRQALDSVEDQVCRDLEHLVVDSGSEDETERIVGGRSNRVRLLVRPCRNVADAFNWGLKHATGELIGWLNADDMYWPGAVDKAVALWDKHPQTDVYVGSCRLLDENGLVLRRRYARRCSARHMDRGLWFWGPAVFCHRRVFERWGALNSELQYCEDFDFFLRIALGGGVFRRTWSLLGGRRMRTDARRHGNPSAERRLAVARETNRVALAHFGRVSVPGLLEQAQAQTEVDGIFRWQSAQWDRRVIAHGMQAGAEYHGVETDKTRLAAGLVLRHVRKETQQVLRRPRYALRFLPAAARDAVQRFLSRKIFTTRYLSPQPVCLPAWYHQQQPPPGPPRISIVTPNLNQGPFLEATLRSVLDQGYPQLEYIVQDGGSTDESLDILRRYGERLTRWESVPDRGQSDAINRGMQHTTGEIMAYLNSDDLLLPGSLAYVAGYFRDHPDVDIVYGHRLLVNEQGNQIGRWILPPHDDIVITWADYIPQETMFWRRRAWERAGGCIDDSFAFAMDWDLILRFREAGLRFARLPRFLGAFRITEEQKTSQLIATVGAREMARLRYRVHGAHASNRRIRRAVRPYIWRHWVYDTLYTAGLARY